MRKLFAVLVLTAACAWSGTSLAPGDKAPDFTLPSSTGAKVKLSDILAKRTVVLAFFPKAGTPG